MKPERKNKGRRILGGLSTIALWQFLAFFMLLLLIWVNEVLDLAALLFKSDPDVVDVFRGSVLSACVIVTAIITVGHTYLQQKKIISGFVTVCSKCHKVRMDTEVWKTMESYISEHSPVDFSHGLCPQCYDTEMSALETQMAGKE